MNEKFIFGEYICYGDSYMKFVVYHSKNIRLHEILHFASSAVRSHSCKSSDSCYMIGGGQKSCEVGNVTGLLFCFK